MRQRMELELAGERRGRYHAKLGYGGLLDVEFVVQWLQMRHGDDEAVRTPGTWDALRALAARGHLEVADADALGRGWELSRGCIQTLRLRDEAAEPYLYEGGREVEQLARRLGLRDRDGQRASDVLVSTWRRSAAAVREVFERIVAPVGTAAPWERES
jgi:glutamate-ammonia-ligase adenylyltransferase